MAPLITPRSRRWRRVGGAGVAVVLAGAGVLGWQLSRGAVVSGYRTTVAGSGSVQKGIDLTGSVEPVDRATLSFGVTGTVATVTVAVGQQVSAGQTLATLTPASLDKQVTLDDATLRAAQANLAADESAQRADAADDHAGSATDPAATDPATSDPATPSGTAVSATGGGASKVAAAQQALTTAQQAVDTDKQTAAAALATAQAACGQTTQTTPSSSSTRSSTSGTVPTAKACSSDLAAALSAQEALATAQAALAEAETALAVLLSGTTSPAGGSSGAGHAPTTAARTTTAHTGTAHTGTKASVQTASTPEAMAATVATDQASVDSDEATLIAAEQSVVEATLKTPVAGTVGALDLVKGQSAGGAQAVVATIVSEDSFEATALLSAAQVQEVALGDRASVQVDGRTGTLEGTVVRVGPVDTSAGDDYPVIVTLPQGAPRLFTGSLAHVTVTVERVDDVLCVPTSAVHTDGAGNTGVYVLHNGRQERVHVKVGLVGQAKTQILGGLRAGEAVVLAVLTKPLPTTKAPATKSSQGFVGGPTIFFSKP